ncbi:MAG: ABC transporter permease [Symbiobacteriaceae bacterium]|nr:ABC transporter permease [Symbiobacteriaceae bacterium]
MYLITNALKNLWRNAGRNILIAAIMLAIITSTVVTLTINNAAAKIIDDIRLNLGSRVEIGQDFMEMRAAGLDGRTDSVHLSIDDFYAFATSDYLRKTIFSASMYGWSNTFCALRDDPSNPGARERGDGQGGIVLDETCKLISTSDPTTLSEFGTLRHITSGRMFAELNECIISEELAALNGIALGDVITLQGAIVTDKHYSLTVIGIYADFTDEYSNFMFMFNRPVSENRRNEILTSFATLISAGWETSYGLHIRNEYYLKNPDHVRFYEQEVRSKGLPITYNVAINQAAYDKVTGPLSGMKGAAFTFMVVILLLGTIVLALISFMAVRERKYEVGVLRAMGLARSKVAFGILAETVMIAALCLVLGLGIGSAVAQPIADNMLEERVAVAEAEDAASGLGNRVLFAQGQMQTNDKAAGYTPESEIQVRLGGEVITQIMLITLALTALAGVIGVTLITQYEPLKILRERN